MSFAKAFGVNGLTLRKQLKCGNVPQSLRHFNTDIPSNVEAILAKQIWKMIYFTVLQERIYKLQGICLLR